MIENKLEMPFARQELYDPGLQNEACKLGFIVHIKGNRSHRIVREALTLLRNISERKMISSHSETSESAGIMLQIPHAFLAQEMRKQQLELPQAGQYAVGMLFMPQDESARAAMELELESIIHEEQQALIGWRTVPTNDELLHPAVLALKPHIRQVFIGRNESLKDELAFERKLYIIRKRAEQAIRYADNDGANGFYIASLSSQKIVYKGLLAAKQLPMFYAELRDEMVVTALALVHSGISPRRQLSGSPDGYMGWELAHPFHYLIYSGEMNTLRGNRNVMEARQSLFGTEWHGESAAKLQPLYRSDESGAVMFDHTLELLYLSGRSLPHAATMMIPEPWHNDSTMSSERKAFYEYNSMLMEAWEGPAALAFTDGTQIGAMLDRSGFRSARYCITKDDLIVLGPEAGALDIAEDQIVSKASLQPGRMLLVDTAEGRIVPDAELKERLAAAQPYRQWLEEQLIELEDLPEGPELHSLNHAAVLQRQQLFGFTAEDVRRTLEPMAGSGLEPIAAMGYDSPLAVLSERPQRLYHYFKQRFAQAAHPPMDAVREKLLTATVTTIGPERNLLQPGPESCRHIKLNTPILSNEQFAKLRHMRQPGFKTITLPILFRAQDGEAGLRTALNLLCEAADRLISKGHNILILSDRAVDQSNAAIPALLAVSALHQHLLRQGTRTKAALLLESGEPREAHHYALLLSYGVNALNPYLAFESIDDMISEGTLRGISHEKAVRNFIKAATKGIVRIMSKIGIATIQAYRGVQAFEALGLRADVVEQFFTGTPSRIGGIGLDVIAEEALKRHSLAFAELEGEERELDSGGNYQWRKDGEEHLFNPQTIHTLQMASRANDYKLYKKFSSLVQGENKKHLTLRSLLEFKCGSPSIALEEVEPVESIVKRFKTGAMSYGSISKEAHESLAIAMNRLGAKSNSGEGGEDPARIKPDANGDSRRSRVKQIASGRFGVTSSYLVDADEIQIKLAQGSKPGEGGQLPGLKVYPWIAEVRGTTPGVGLISPPLHHDIHSIEDIAGLIYDLKNANPHARINVKLVSDIGVGGAAIGVARGLADVIMISGYDGGSGASPMGSIRHAGLPWELGLAEAHQSLMQSNLRDRVTIETDGKMMTGRDVAIAALLGAEEYSFSTAPLIVLGCIMMRVCHLDTCPVGVAAQNPELRKKFTGDPSHIVNYLRFIAEELREIMAELGFRTIIEMIGRVDRLETKRLAGNYKAKDLDLSCLLHESALADHAARHWMNEHEHGLELSLDMQQLVPKAQQLLESAERRSEGGAHVEDTSIHENVQVNNYDGIIPVRACNRAVGTRLGYEVTRRFGAEGLPEDTIKFQLAGTSGSSFGAFIPQGITLFLEGESNDHLGKGLSGGKIIAAPSPKATFKAEENIITGHAALYGATSGHAYIRGIAGDRFAVRNSGAYVVVEGIGDHGCEYMTGGRVVVLGETGRNFAAGMSGGVAYVYDDTGQLFSRCNIEMVLLERLEEEDDVAELRVMLERHAEYTGSAVASRILADWEDALERFVKVIPKDYKRMLEHIRKAEDDGVQGRSVMLAAFEANKRELMRITGR